MAEGEGFEPPRNLDGKIGEGREDCPLDDGAPAELAA